MVAKKKQALGAELRSQGDERMKRGDASAGDDRLSALVAYTEAARLYARMVALDPGNEELRTLESLAKRKAEAESYNREERDADVEEDVDAELGEAEAATIWVRPKVDPLTEGLGDYAAARPLQEAVAASFASKFGANDERTVQARMQLARTLRRLGQHAAARPEYEAVLAAKGDPDAEFAVQRTSRVIAQANLAELLYENLGEHEEGVRLMQEVVETWNVELGKAHTQTQHWAATLARWQEMTPLKPGAARAAAQVQLGESSSVVAVCVEGLLSMPDFNGVYLAVLPVGGSPHQDNASSGQQAWPRFESAEGKHLFRQVEHGLWMLRDEYDPDAEDAGVHQTRPIERDTGSIACVLFQKHSSWRRRVPCPRACVCGLCQTANTSWRKVRVIIPVAETPTRMSGRHGL